MASSSFIVCNISPAIQPLLSPEVFLQNSLCLWSKLQHVSEEGEGRGDVSKSKFSHFSLKIHRLQLRAVQMFG